MADDDLVDLVLTPEFIAHYDELQRQAREITTPAIDALFAQWIAMHATDRTGAQLARAITFCLGRAVMQRAMDAPPGIVVELLAGSIAEGMSSVDTTAFSLEPATPGRRH